MKMLTGIAASMGIAIGKVMLLDHQDLTVPARPITEEEVPNEIMRLEDALTATRAQILKIQSQIAGEMGREHAEIFEAHLMVIEDRTLIEDVIRRLKSEKVNVEHVFSKAIKKYTSAFLKIDDEYLRDRVADINDVGRRMIANLIGENRGRLDNLTEKVIIIAYDLSPSDTATMHKKNVIGFATDIGGRTSHTAIMAKALEIPAVVGVERVTNDIKDGDEVIIDGMQGVLIVNPDDATRAKYEEERRRFLERGQALLKQKDLPSVTRDGRRIALYANIELPDELDSVISHGAEGVGLFRTEYLYLNRKNLPTEDEQFESYKMVVERMKPAPVVIRTLDLGGDKFLSQIDMPHEMNPFLGWRAIRFCLAMPHIFKTQLRAILRASALGDVKVMYPLISGVEEIKKANEFLEQAKQELVARNVAFDQNLEVGAMIEIPSAALTCDLLAKEVKFFSIGTNDLIQYALAADRVNEKIAYLYDPAHPAVLRLIQDIIRAGQKYKIPVSLCGEMGGDPELSLLLVGMGLRQFSLSPMILPEIKAIVRSVSFSHAQRISKKALTFATGAEVSRYARSELRRIVKGKPSLLDLYGDEETRT